MKIGILTYHRAHNYGALLQAIALRYYLSSLNHDVFFLNYWPKYHKNLYDIFSLNRLRSFNGFIDKILYLKECLFFKRWRMERYTNFMTFIDNNIVPFSTNTNDHFDLLLYGSDQIWRKQPILKDYNPVYFAENNFSATKHVSYAASMGILPESKKDISRIVKYMANFDLISVRENNLKEFLINNGINNVYQVLDPTLLLSAQQWIDLLHIQKKENHYLLFYNLMAKTFDEVSVKSIATSKNLSMVTLLSKANCRPTELCYSTADPRTFIELIYNADFIVTSSFHGLVFSILFKKQFVASFRDNSERANSLLKSLGINNRLLPANTKIEIPLDVIDYTEVDKRLLELRSRTISFLNKL